TYFYPDSAAAQQAILCQITLQRDAGGNALIGRQLYPLMVEAGLDAVRVSPRMRADPIWSTVSRGRHSPR
ncbi:MAG: hypothetical protein ACRD2A_19625, partial [Vicinamibacterales bacterium]